MLAPLRERSSALDVSLLGAILAGVAFYGGNLSVSGGTSPNLIRFYDKPPGTQYPATLPQDKALLLLADPTTTASSGAAGVAGAPLDPLWKVLFAVGVVVLLAGPVLAWQRRGE